jgi:D-serine deaminase-like pyridoxal phosphate-dependent protein
MSPFPAYAAALRDLRLPLAYVDLALFDKNATDLVRRVQAGTGRALPIRAASKSIRCVALMERLLAREGYAGLMCYSAAEAAWLSRELSQPTHLLVAYPTLEPADVRACLEACAQDADITLMVDDAAQVRVLGQLAEDYGQTLSVALDLDMSLRLPGLHFGVRRSPLHSPRAALDLASAVADHASLRLDGVMGYEAQVAGLQDAVPKQRAMNAGIRLLKRASIMDLQKRRADTVAALHQAGHTLRFVNGGGTGSLEATARDRSVSEVAGSGLYSPTLFDNFSHFHHAPAAGFVLPVVRRPAPGFVTCHGGGYVASGSAGPEKLPMPMYPEGLRLLPSEGAGEVQTPLQLDAGVTLSLGDPVFFRHAKAGELCEHFNHLVLLERGQVVDEVPTYRGQGRSFL